MAFVPDRPYNDLSLLPPDVELETPRILRHVISASRQLAALNQACALLPNPEVLINTIPVLEAHDSSEIENIVTTQDALFKLASKESASADPHTKEAYRYRTALNSGFEKIVQGGVSIDLLLHVCSELHGGPVELRDREEVIIGNRLSGKAVYTPPRGRSAISQLLKNWEKYAQADAGPDPLIRMAVLHYQLEAIHPFLDGNGRTGRIMNILFLVQHGLLSLPVLYLSHYILRTRLDYYSLLSQVNREQAWEAWIIYLLIGIEETAAWTLERIQRIRELMVDTARLVQEKEPRMYRRELVEIIFNQPYCRISNLVDAGIAERQTASEYLKKLVGLDILREEKSGREKLYVHTALLTILKES